MTVEDMERLADMAAWTGLVRGVSKAWGETMTMQQVFPSYEDWTGDNPAVPAAVVDPNRMPWG